jgi:hypothetical protein
MEDTVWGWAGLLQFTHSIFRSGTGPEHREAALFDIVGVAQLASVGEVLSLRGSTRPGMWKLLPAFTTDHLMQLLEVFIALGGS